MFKNKRFMKYWRGGVLGLWNPGDSEVLTSSKLITKYLFSAITYLCKLIPLKLCTFVNIRLIAFLNFCLYAGACLAIPKRKAKATADAALVTL